MRWLILGQHPKELSGPVRVEMEVTAEGITVRLSHSMQKRPRGMRADLDNHVKAVLDVLSPQLYDDDRQVTELSARFQ
jgi:Holliday junction resolvase RusA-like endonuclease